MFEDLPEIDRTLDKTAEGGGRLEKFSEAAQPLFEEMLLKAINFGDLRDPDKVRTQFQGKFTVTPLSAAAAPGGRTIEVFFSDPDPSDPLVPLGETSVGWIFLDAEGSEFTVNSVHKLDDRGPVLELSGTTLPSTEAELGVGLADATLRPPGLISLLGADYGLSVDTHEPEAFQRSGIRNVSQWLTLKGTVKSYDILGKIAGYRAVPLGLWGLGDPVPANVPSDHLFELPIGSGSFYTDLDPSRAFFDEVGADIIPLDMYCYETPNWVTDVIEPPTLGTVPDGTTVEAAIGSTMQGLTIVSTVDLGGDRWRVRVTGDLSPVVGIDYWWAEFAGEPGDTFYMETLPVEVVPGDWEFEVFGSSPTFGLTVNINYECHIEINCSYCRASVIRVEVTPVEVLSDPDALLDGVLTRLVQKILQVVPIHVRLTDIVHLVGPVQATLDIKALVTSSPSVLVAAPVGYYFDVVPADELELDPDHMVASATQFTVP